MPAKNIFKQWFKSEDTSSVPSTAEHKGAPSAVSPSAKLKTKQAQSASDQHTIDHAQRMLGKRWQTEKAIQLETASTYSFILGDATNASMVAEHFKALTGVPARAVHILWRYPKRGARGNLTRRKQKIARVSVAKGTTVNFPSESGASHPSVAQ